MAEVVTVESSDEGEDNSVDLTSEECGKRCKDFAEITGTDTALAMFYLQDREWILETALNDYFQSQGESTSTIPVSLPSTRIVPSLTVNSSSSTSQNVNIDKTKQDKASKIFLTTAPPVLQPQKEGVIRILSWNIDGLDPDNLQSRTEGVCSILQQENPEVIFLQELVQRSLAILKTKMSNTYHIHTGGGNAALSPNAYFTAILVRKDSVKTEYVKQADFPTTKMYRDLLEIHCFIKSVPVTLMTSHLESTAEYSDERRRQLKIAFDQMKKQSPEKTTIFGGDLNLRDKELTQSSAKPQGVYDIWECTGKRPEAKFTWDLKINDNKQLHNTFQPRCRFDRMYISHPENKVRLKPVYFELVGIQRLSSCRRFPSDHWGILSHLRIEV